MKSIVSIISSESPVPAYLFIREKYVSGDRLVFISARDAKPTMSYLIKLLGVPKELVQAIVFYREDDEFTYERICRRLREELNPDERYFVNLAGGTRYMALAVQQAFSKLKSDFFYVNLRDNTIIKSTFDDSIDDNDDFIYPIRRRMTIREYLTLHGIEHDAADVQRHKPIRSENYANMFFDYFISKRLNDRDYGIIERLSELSPIRKPMAAH